MNIDTISIIALIAAILIVLLTASAVITMALREGSLQADLRWTKRYINRQIKHYSRTSN